MSDIGTTKSEEIATDGEAVQVAESVPETAPSSAEGYGMAKQNEPKTAELPTGNRVN